MTTKSQVVAMRVGGYTYREIAERYSMPISRAYSLCVGMTAEQERESKKNKNTPKRRSSKIKSRQNGAKNGINI